MSAAHCRGCHLTFGDDIGFDAHHLTGRCVAPSVLGLIVQGGVWGGLLSRELSAVSGLDLRQ